MDSQKNFEQDPKLKSEKKAYETPILTVHGNVEEITRHQWQLGTGDTWMKGILGGVLAGGS